VDPVRIALVEMPPIISRLLRAILAREPDLHVVATADDGGEMLDRLEDADPDVILWGVAGPALADRALPLMRRRAELPVVGIASAGRDAAVCTLAPDLERVETLSADTLVALVRRLGGDEP
jgi:chemotaxis response regulator CheB